MANYPIPPWLSPDAAQSHASLYATGAKIGQDIVSERDRVALEGARIAQQNAQLQQAAQEAQMRHDVAQRELERNTLIDQQKLQIEAAYNEARIGIEQSKLEQDAKQVAARAMAQQMFAKDYQDLIAAGKSQSEAYQEALMKNGPALFSSAASGGPDFVRAATPPPQEMSNQFRPALNPDGTPNENYGVFQAGKGSQQVVPLNPNARTERNIAHQEKNAAEREQSQIRMAELRQAQADKASAQKVVDRWAGLYPAAKEKQKNGKRLDANEESTISKTEAAKKIIDDLDKKIADLKAQVSSKNWVYDRLNKQVFPKE